MFLTNHVKNFVLFENVHWFLLIHLYRFLHICKTSTIQSLNPIRKIVLGLFQKPYNMRKAS